MEKLKMADVNSILHPATNADLFAESLSQVTVFTYMMMTLTN